MTVLNALDSGHREILIVRHGATRLNNDDVSVDRIRGWKDVPLSADGRKEAERLADELAKHKPAGIVSSDLCRAYDTAKIISDKTKVPIEDVSKVFRPWNLGIYAGELSKKAIPIIAAYATDKPAVKIPDGESFENFEARFMNGVADALYKFSGVLAVVTHHRGERLLMAWKKAGYPVDGEVDRGEFTKKGEHTGTVQKYSVPLVRLRAAANVLARRGGK